MLKNYSRYYSLIFGMPLTKPQKEEIVSRFSTAFKKSSLLIFLNFHGLSVAKGSELRRKLRQAGAIYLVAKKRLAHLVLKQENIEMPKLEGEVAFVFGGGELAGGSDDAALAAAREVESFAKTHQEGVKILGGVFEKALLDMAGIVRLAKIPSRPVLLSQLLGVLQGPARELVGVLNGNQRKLVMALREIVKKKA